LQEDKFMLLQLIYALQEDKFMLLQLIYAFAGR
jgi:hypothetical protein